MHKYSITTAALPCFQPIVATPTFQPFGHPAGDGGVSPIAQSCPIEFAEDQGKPSAFAMEAGIVKLTSPSATSVASVVSTPKIVIENVSGWPINSITVSI